jgi:hypothetical protein
MSTRLTVLAVALIGFGTLTSLALVDVGYWGILQPHFRSWGGAQVFADLIIVCVLSFGCAPTRRSAAYPRGHLF